MTYTGEAAHGVEAAGSLDQLREILAARDLILQSGRLNRGAAQSGKPPLRHIANFNRELTVLLQAGISIPESLALLAGRPGQAKLDRAIEMVRSEVHRGVSLSEGMAKAPQVFDTAYRALVATGEQAGALPDCLERYQRYIDLRLRTGAALTKAMIYPAVLTITLSAVLTFLFIAVIPNFVAMYKELGSALPLPTQILIGIEERFPVIASSIAAAIAALWLGNLIWTASSEGAVARDKLLLSFPILGPYRRAAAAAAAVRILSILIPSGTTVTKAIAVAASTIGDRYCARLLDAANEAVAEGNPLGKALARTGLFKPAALRMIEVGEASGSLGRMLTAVAAQQDEALASSLERLTSLMEPAVLLVAGFLVGGVVISMYLPIFTLTELIR
jgi:type IV pilus assembly protein PilC